MTRKTVYVGTAGWAAPAKNRDQFSAGDSTLARYASRFNAAEINSGFYRPHRIATYQRRAQCVPPGFRFAVKLPKAITHVAKLVGVHDALAEFVAQVSGLGEKLGPLLVQLPPKLELDAGCGRSRENSVRGGPGRLARITLLSAARIPAHVFFAVFARVSNRSRGGTPASS